MRLLVCGGREFERWQWLSSSLDYVDDVWPLEALICGMAHGADTLAERWAKYKGIPVLEFPARWRDYGRAAGAKRNAQMLQEGKPDLVIAFPGGRGTANMCALARAANVEVWEMGSKPIAEFIQERNQRIASAQRA